MYACVLCMYVWEFVRGYVSYNKEVHNLATNTSIRGEIKSWQMSLLKQQGFFYAIKPNLQIEREGL